MDREVFLTFDDGPHPVFTRIVLETLGQFGAQATFFVVGNRAINELRILEWMARDGHTVGNHTYTHSDLTRLGDEEIRRELTTTEAVISPYLGFRRLLRPPYGRLDKRTSVIAQSLGYQIRLWNNDPRDWHLKSQPTRWIRSAVEVLRSTGKPIILCHDIHRTTATHLGELIRLLQAEGYTLASMQDSPLTPCDRKATAARPL